jgi:hypothetical protein
MRTILALGVAMLMLAGCPNYGTVEWSLPDPGPTAPGPDMTGPTAPGPDLADASPPDMGTPDSPDAATPPDMTCVSACQGKVCGSDDGCGAECKEGSGCTVPDMSGPPDAGAPPDMTPPPDAGCVPPPPIADCDLPDRDDENGKTTICHIPPGNPANAHTLTVGDPAVAAHLSHHGDYLGPCKAVCQ